MIYLLIVFVLLVCHYLADYPLSTPRMLAAKKHGIPLIPIMDHALVHTILMLCALWGFDGFGYVNLSVPLMMVLLLQQFVSHFCIDVAKAGSDTTQHRRYHQEDILDRSWV